MFGSRRPATRCIARRTDPFAPFCLVIWCIHTLCLGNTWTRAQHGLPLRQRNWGAYSSTSTSGENFLLSNQSTLQADVVLTPIAAYNVDILHGRSAEAFAVTRYSIWFTCASIAPDVCARCPARGDYDDSALRHCITALATASFLPLINRVGVLATDSIAAGVALMSFV
jgi:hypothetical protein